MEDELQKRNTDCVYFLASPLTCKKGSECEYRHSEAVRLNPRDCWYWLSGSCLNPSCAFRHPPLDGGQTEITSESFHNPSAASVNKTNVRCYFFYNGFCNKGVQCTYLHGPVDSAPTWKSSNTPAANPDGPPEDKKASAGSDTGSAPIAMCSHSSQVGHQQTAGRAIMRKAPDLVIQQPTPVSVPKHNASPLTPRSPYEDAVAGSSISPLAAAGSIQKRSHTSSPGFDVLVDDGSEELEYEDDYEYGVDHDGDGRQLNGDGYDDDVIAKDDPEYTVLSTLYGKGHDYDNCFGAERSLDYVREGPASSRRRVLDRVIPPKRKYLPREQASNGQHSVDLRDLLKRRRVVDARSCNHFSRGPESPGLTSQSRERFRCQVEFHGNKFSGSHIEDEGRLRRSSFDRSRLQEKPLLSPEVSGYEAVEKRSYAEESTVFIAPKTLAQIKDEKKRARDCGEPSESCSLDGFVQENFRGPKTLSEILEEKRRLGSVVNGKSDCN